MKDEQRIQTSRTNFNKLIPVVNGKINCYGDGETYNLTELCYDYDDYQVSWHHCTLPTGQLIVLNPT